MYAVSMSKTDLFLKIQLSISTQFSSICDIDRTLSGTTTPVHSGPGSDGNEGVLCIPQSSGITHYQIVSFPIQDTRWEEYLISYNRVEVPVVFMEVLVV